MQVDGKEILQVEPEAIQLLSKAAMNDIAHLLRPGHLQQLRNILDDSEASDNDRFVAMQLLKNANIAAAKVLPSCQVGTTFDSRFLKLNIYFFTLQRTPVRPFVSENVASTFGQTETMRNISQKEFLIHTLEPTCGIHRFVTISVSLLLINRHSSNIHEGGTSGHVH